MKKVISFPAPVPSERGDAVCQEGDGCPTEKAVLQRFWREHQQSARATAEQSQDSVIEECAKVCDEMSATYARRGENGHSSGAYWCADAIRALKSQQDAAIESQLSGDGS